jgi:hypothetical protein
MDPGMTSVTIVAAKIKSRPIFKGFHVNPTPTKLKCLGGYIKPEVLILWSTMHRHGGGTRKEYRSRDEKAATKKATTAIRSFLDPFFQGSPPANLGGSIERA